jgi:glycolate oxidase FAD binding subunit
MSMIPLLQVMVDQVRDAANRGAALRIVGGDSKAFYGNPVTGEPLSTRPLSGIVDYAPTELVVTALAGTPLADVERAIAERDQCFAFEPPRFADGGTVGGMIAAGLSGPARAARGAVRDHLLGASLVNGRGDLLSFGGRVIKNVAGFDVSRLLAGSLGTLGLIVEVSLRVVPRASDTQTLRFEMNEAQALAQLNRWGGRPLPIDASAWFDGQLWVRLSGAVAAVRTAAGELGGERVADPGLPWRDLRDHTHEYFAAAQRTVEQGGALWRLSLPSTAAPLALPGVRLTEWGGAQRWLVGDAPAAAVRAAAQALGGHATLFRGHVEGMRVFAPLAAPVARIHERLMATFDPKRIFNPGRLH